MRDDKSPLERAVPPNALSTLKRARRDSFRSSSASPDAHEQNSPSDDRKKRDYYNLHESVGKFLSSHLKTNKPQLLDQETTKQLRAKLDSINEL